MTTERRKVMDRRRIERRAPKRGVNVRHNDSDPQNTKRVKRARLQ